MILVLTERPDEFGEGAGSRLLPVLQLDNAKQLPDGGTLIRTAGGEVFEVVEDFDDIVALVDALLAAPAELDTEFDDDE